MQKKSAFSRHLSQSICPPTLAANIEIEELSYSVHDHNYYTSFEDTLWLEMPFRESTT